MCQLTLFDALKVAAIGVHNADGVFTQYPNLHEVRLVPSKKDIVFVEYLDEESSGVAKDALHNYKLDGENKIKVRSPYAFQTHLTIFLQITFVRK
ncbi:hypothetical protein ARMSODRAFT_1013198 [Armillaria solidipes]|uniref:RRM domain-containing protein n=1 Tax=Armillaria solidipes TaxID=1076256 RepID=A0A2H3BY27_9AGAR|nr:hypothetical protein ARMSODRAFT_1013198 [Armillaria solidipes]